MQQVPMLDLKLEYEYMKEDIDAALKKCLEHQKWILGPEVKELEDKTANYLGVKHCIGASSGTEALVMSLRALAIKLKGREFFDETDEIITTSFTFTATGDAILRAGATPVFIDIEPDTYNIDTVKIREYLTQNSKLKTPSSKVVGILPVHLYGLSCNMDEIMQLAKEFNLFVVEDVAQAFGGSWKGRKLGSIGTTGAFSFFPSKNLGGFGDGGIVSTNDDHIAELIRMLLRHGGKDKYNVDHIGYNGRLDTLQAAIVLAKFRYIDEFNDRRGKVAGQYNDRLKDIDGITLPKSLPEANNAWHQYTVRITKGGRDEFQKHLKEKGISTMVYYPYPLHKMKVFGGKCKIQGMLNESEQSAKGVLSLPMEPLMKDDQVLAVTKEIRQFFEKLR